MPASGLPEHDAARPGPELAGVIRGRPSINPIRAQASTNRQNHRSSHKKSVTMFKAFGAVVQANPKPTARTAPVEQRPHSNGVMFSAPSFGRACGAQEKTRTSTTVRSLAPEASASTNSATWAGDRVGM